MLVLRRRVGEAVLVGEVEIEIVEISRSRVRLGIRAPSHISVIRKEAQSVAQENRLASDLMGNRGPEAVGKLLQLLNRTDTAADPAGPDSKKIGTGRYVTSEQYVGHREERENPHPA